MAFEHLATFLKFRPWAELTAEEQADIASLGLPDNDRFWWKKDNRGEWDEWEAFNCGDLEPSLF